MRYLTLSMLPAILLSACEYWPEELEPLAESIDRQVSGETTAWRVGGDVVVINVAGSPLYQANAPELEATATNIATQAIASVPEPLASVSVTFHEGEVSEDAEKMREFIFLVKESGPVLQPRLDFGATGPLTLAEIEASFLSLMDEPLTGARRECVLSEIEARARAAGDPETLDPTTVESLPDQHWSLLDPAGKRLILMQVITTQASFACLSSGAQLASNAGTATDPTGMMPVIVPGDPRFEVFESGAGSLPGSRGTVLLSFRARDARYCRAASFSSDHTVVLACRTEQGWEVNATSRLAPGESTTTTVFGGGDMSAVVRATEDLKAGADLLDEREVMDAASRGWR